MTVPALSERTIRRDIEKSAVSLTSKGSGTSVGVSFTGFVQQFIVAYTFLN